MSPANAEIEKRRLNVLWQYEVLDTIPEQLFDDLTELAAVICEAPIALISMVDESRQWFKSRFGTTIEETSRDISFCAYAIQQSELFIIPDATLDERFANNPLVISDPKIRFYAGAPLITPDGYALGTLCVIDTVPRELRPDQKQALRILARHAVLQLELRRRTQDVRSGRATMTEATPPGTDEEIARLKKELAKARHDVRQQSKKTVTPRRAKKPIRSVSRPKTGRKKR